MEGLELEKLERSMDPGHRIEVMIGLKYEKEEIGMRRLERRRK
jgi:hypothetical protein